MAKNRDTKVQVDTGKEIITPSAYGSHKSMLVKDLGDKVICKDEDGEYETYKNRLDTGLADPKRWSRKRDN